MTPLFKRYISYAAMLCVTALGAVAQEATVKRMEHLPMDLSAAKYPRLDLNGAPCALVRVEVIADGVDFFGDVIKPVEHKMGEYWVYMVSGSKMLQIKSDAFLPLMVNFADYGINGLLPKVTYVVTLTLPSAQPQSAAAGMNYLVMSVSPATARVTVDGKDREVRDGKAKIMLRNGTYPYHVEAPGYLPANGNVTVNGTRAEKTVLLRSTKGTLSVTSTTPGTEIYVNGERMGTGTWRGELLPDSYLVEGRHPSYRTADRMVAVTTGETSTVTLPALIPITGALNIDYEPVGASVSVDGARAGVTPTVIDNLLVGGHSITISADGYTPATLAATVTEGQITTLAGRLETEGQITTHTDKLDAQVINPNYKYFKGPNGMYGFKDEIGNIVIPAKYDKVYNFSDGVAPVNIYGKWGYIDKNDTMVIPAKYKYIYAFKEGLAPVCINGKWGFIDKNDTMVIPAKYDHATCFGDGLAPVEINGKWGYIDKNDTTVIPAKYDQAWSFKEGKGLVELNGRTFHIDKNGNEVK